MRQWRAMVLVMGGAAAMVAGGVATNQILDNGNLSWHWAYLAFGFGVLAAVFSLHAAAPGPAGQRAPGVRWGANWTFRRQLRAAVADMETIGVMTQGEFVLRMEQVYVDVALRPRPVRESERDSGIGHENREPPGRRGPLSSFLDEGRVFAVIGAPGSGKTTLVRRVALELCRWKWRARLPVLLYLRDHAKAILDGRDLADVAVSVPWLHGRIPANWLARRLDRGRCIVLLDGLDEVADEAARKQVVTWVQGQIDRYPRTVFVVTSRPHGYTSNKLRNADEMQVQRFAAEQISQFLHAWYRAIEQRARQGSAHHIRQVADRQAEDLLKRLRGQVALYDLAANPLLLTMIANVHRYRNKLPDSRAELYEEMCDVLLHRRQESKDLADPTGLSGPQKMVVVQHLAAHMMRIETRDIPLSDSAVVVERPLAEVGGRQDLTARTFLEEVRKSGLLVEREHGRYGFAHLTLQEYLAAAHIREHPELLSLLTDNVENPWWREATLLWAATADATPVIEACLVIGTVNALALAADCADEARRLTPATRARLNEILSSTDVADGRSPEEWRKFIAALTATRELRKVVWLDSTTALCVRPVSTPLWNLFAHQEDRHTPMAPVNAPFPDIGITANDARRFVTWLNTLFDQGAAYRLPTIAEAARIDPALLPARRTFWTSDENALGLYRPAGAHSPYRVTVRQANDLAKTVADRLLPLRGLLSSAQTAGDLPTLLGYACLFADPERRPVPDAIHVLDLMDALHWATVIVEDLRRHNQPGDAVNALTEALIHILGLVHERAHHLDITLDLGALHSRTLTLDEAAAAALDHASGVARHRAHELLTAAGLGSHDLARTRSDGLFRVVQAVVDLHAESDPALSQISGLSFNYEYLTAREISGRGSRDLALGLALNRVHEATHQRTRTDGIIFRVRTLSRHQEYASAFARALGGMLGPRYPETMPALAAAWNAIAAARAQGRPTRGAARRWRATSLESFLDEVLQQFRAEILDPCEDPVDVLDVLWWQFNNTEMGRRVLPPGVMDGFVDVIAHARDLIRPILDRRVLPDPGALNTAGICLVGALALLPHSHRSADAARALGTVIALSSGTGNNPDDQMLVLVRDS